MSDKNNIPNEEELWDLLGTEPVAESKADKKPKSEPKFAKPKAEPKAAPAAAPVAAPAEPAPKSERKLDGFFYGCMAGVAAVSVAATLLVSSMLGGGSTSAHAVKDPAEGTTPIVETDDSRLQELERQNAELRAQLELQKQQIKDLQGQLIEAVGSEEYLATAPTNPDGETDGDVMTEQMKAYEIFTSIKAAYADFDRAALEELIPQMDEMLSYLSSDALNEYYLILEYVEQPSNG